jgi:hypothetical protein
MRDDDVIKAADEHGIADGVHWNVGTSALR